MRRRSLALYLAAAIMAVAVPLHAHETDHYTAPPGRDIADLGDHFTRWAYNALAGAVDQANADARRAIERGDEQALQRIGTQDYIFDVTWRQFPAAYFVIEDLEALAHSSAKREQHPGQVVGYKPMFGGVYTGAYLPIDPRQTFRIWHASVVKAYGVYFGTDKVGHFTDMGKNYYQAYRNARRNGADEREARAAAVALGTDHPIYSEAALLGFWTAGAYSNGDLASNYAGFLFYRNLAEPITVAGEQRPPLMEWDGRQWQLADHVQPDSDFFSYFITHHWDEALNPSLYELSMRAGFRRNMLNRAEDVLWRYRDVNGNRRLPTYFLEKAVELSTFAGEDYGHRGGVRDLLTLAEFYEPFDEDAPLDARNARGHTPLHDAVAWGDVSEARRLLHAGADVNARVASDEAWPGEGGCTPLHLAARAGRSDLVSLLIEHSADPTLRDGRGATAAHHAAGHADAMALLLDAGLPLDGRTQNGQTPLHWAAAMDDADSVALLLDRGANPDVADAAGRTALHRAARHASAATIAALAEHADLTLGDTLDATPLHLAAARQDAAADDVVRTLLSSGADPNAADARGRTAMHEAARTGRRPALALLAEHGGAINGTDAWGTTPLHIATRDARHSTAVWLIDHGAAVDIANAAGITPLHEAAFAGSAMLVRRLVEGGADPRVRDGLGRTPARVATQAGWSSLGHALEVRRTASPVVTADD